MTDWRPADETRRADEELEGLLRAYFRAEMPEPWPAAPATPAAEVPVAVSLTPRPLERGRLALAASVALLAAGLWIFAGRGPVSEGKNLSPGGTLALDAEELLKRSRAERKDEPPLRVPPPTAELGPPPAPKR